MLLSLLIGSMLVAGADSAACHDSLFSYYPASDMCYAYYEGMVDFTSAKLQCEMDGTATLVMPKTEEEELDLQTVLATTFNEVWLGMTDQGLTKEYMWLDMSGPVTQSEYTNWNVDPAAQTMIFDCAGSRVVDGNRKWFPKPCNGGAHLVCQAKPLEPTCNTKKGWVKMQSDNCFKAYRGHRRFNYNQAKSYCLKAGGVLAKDIVSEQQRKEVGKLFKFNDHFWVGFNDQDGDGDYTDTSGVTMTGADDAFKRGLPRSGRCISFRKRWLFSKSCHRRQRVICQKPADIPT